MINMNSPTVQNIINSTGYNPFVNGEFVPPQPRQFENQNIQAYAGYNPYIANQVKSEFSDLDNWQYYYDPMPNVVINEARGINSNRAIYQPNNMQYMYNNPYAYNAYNSTAFNGYMNPILANNMAEQRRISDREEAIRQGSIWRSLLGNVKLEDGDFDIDDNVKFVESCYYYEPIKQEISMKDRMIIDKNNHVAQIEANIAYYKRNNMPLPPTPIQIQQMNLYNYYNHINSIIGDTENCDMFDYFTRVYPELKFEDLSFEAHKFNKNLKNKYTNGDFSKLVNKVSADKPDSYYYKIMEAFAEDGVKFETPEGLIITADHMEVKLPERFLKRRNKQDLYYEQRKKFYDSVFRKEQ